MSDMKLAVIVRDDTVAQSIYKDAVTAIMVSFCVYISQNSTWWTFITGLMFIMFMLGRVKGIIDKNNEFKTKKDLQKWVDELPDL